MTIRMTPKETKAIFKTDPSEDYHCELVHINITEKCGRNCPYCYVDRSKGRDMAYEDFKAIIDKCVANKVFQVTIGGGEPFMHPEISKFVDYASQRINICTTSNGDAILAANTMRKFRQVNISYHEDLKDLEDKIKKLKDLDIRRGINFVYNKSTEHAIEHIYRIAKDHGAEILILQFKPTKGEWDQYISPEETYKAAKELANRQEVPISIDGATCYQCMMKRRFMTVQIDGTVTPCSFVHEPNMGNILKQDFQEIWKNRGDMILCPYMKDKDKEKLCHTKK